jgi:hypothetical protein
MYFCSNQRGKVIQNLVQVYGVDYADAAVIVDYARDNGPHVIPGHPARAVWWFGDHWRISGAPG